MATNKGQFSDRTRTYHRTPATSSPGYKVRDIIDQAYRRLNEPSLSVNSSAMADRLANGVFALRGLLDTINSDPTLYQPPEYVSYTIPIQPSLTWGLGGWDIDDQPPLEIKSLWFSSENTSYEYGAFGQLTEMSMADLARYRDLRRYEFTNYEPRRFFFEKTWPIRRIHFDINLGRGVDDLTARPERIPMTWENGAGRIPGYINFLTSFQAVAPSEDAPASFRFNLEIASGREALFGTTFVIEFAPGQVATFRRDPSNTSRYTSSSEVGVDTGDGEREVVIRRNANSEPLITSGDVLIAGTGVLNGFIVKAFALPEDANAVANYELHLPPGYFEYILCGLAIRLSSLSSKPLPQAILFAFNQAKFGLMARADGVEHDTDLGFITPSPRYYRNIDSL